MTGTSLNTRLLARWRQPEPDATISIYCVPHAGMGAGSVRAFVACAPPEWDVVAVRRPGREIRIMDDPAVDLGSATAELAHAVATDQLRSAAPVVLLGQSSGAVLAYETARVLAADGLVDGLVVVSRAAPRTLVPVPDAAAPDDVFLRGMDQFGGLPAGLRDEPEAMELLLPALRGDLAMVAEYRRDPDHPMGVPITAVRGTQDRFCSPEAVAAWIGFGGPESRYAEIPGGHFLLTENPAALVATIAHPDP